MILDVVDLTNDVRRAPIERAEKALSALQRDMRAEGGNVKAWSSELMPIILVLREALE